MPIHVAEDGTRIHYRVTGSGQPVVLIPGLGGDGAFWSAVAEHLGSNWSVISVDHRGAGQSDRLEAPYSIPGIAADVLGVMAQEGAHSAAVVGHSTGGMIAQAIAVTTPERIERLVLSGTWERRTFRFRRMFEARIALLRHAGPRDYHRLTQALGYDDAWLESHAAEMEAELDMAETRLAPLGVQIARMQMLLEYDCHEALGRIACPTLVVAARDDALIPLAHARRLAELIPGAGFAELAGGHFFPRAYPTRFVKVVEPFLQGWRS